MSIQEILSKALITNKESQTIEFKASFDVDSPREWCELIKDIIALANTDGGVILIGVDDTGQRTGFDVQRILLIDHADLVNKIHKYTNVHFSQVEITAENRDGGRIAAFRVEQARSPIVFTHPGSYDIGAGKQRNAFSQGTVYFRHGAKSEPGTSNDIRSATERQLKAFREEWTPYHRVDLQSVQTETDQPWIEGTIQRPSNPLGTESSVLASYFEFMVKLISDGRIADPENVGLRAAASARTLSVLRELGPYGKLQILLFLRDADMITLNRRIISLNRADLTQAFLRKMDLSGLDLSETNLKGAWLDRSDLRGTKLQGACLENAVLEEADLSNADLSGACLRQARLLDANLARSLLIRADLTEAMTIGTWREPGGIGAAFGHFTNFEGANLTDAVVPDIELIQACGVLKDAILPNGALVEEGE